MRPFHLKEEEVTLINHLRHLSLCQQDMVAFLVSDLESKTALQPLPYDSKIAPIRAVPSR
jgi:hypothetical protein